MPIEYVEEFQKLQDEVNPMDFSTMKEVIEEELEGSIDDIFMEFKETPIASASLAEVYWAKLKTGGEEVVVKVQRPLVRKRMLADIQILKKTCSLCKLYCYRRNSRYERGS